MVFLALLGEMVAEWIVCGTLNLHIAGSNLSTVSWLLCNILGQDVNKDVTKSLTDLEQELKNLVD